MLKDQKDELITQLKRKNADLEEQYKLVAKQNEEYKKGDSQAESKLKAQAEMHAQKIKTLLRSIQLLKKEVQKEKFDKKDNVRAQKIEALNRDIQYCEVAINALRKLVNSEDKCDQAIKMELDKGPKRIRVASREELKMDINKYKNMTLRLLEILKQNGIKQPTGFKIDQGAGTGLKEDKIAAMFDINNMSEQAEQNNDPNIGSNAEGDLGLNDQELLEEKERLEDQLMKQNMEIKEKNEKLLELLDELEEIKIQVYARDKSIELQQKQIEDLLEELRDAKTLDNEMKILTSKKIALEEENLKLKKEMNEKFVVQNDKQTEQNELVIENKLLQDQMKQMQKILEQERADSKQAKAKVDNDRAQLVKDLAAAKAEVEKTKKELAGVQKAHEDQSKKLAGVDTHVQGVIGKKEEDLDAYRKRVLELEKELKASNDKIVELQAKIVELSKEVQEKEMELEFYQANHEEVKQELQKVQAQKPPVAGGQQPVDNSQEVAQLKQKLKTLMRNEVALHEEIDRLKEEKAQENQQRGIKNIVERSKSRGRDGMANTVAENNAGGGFNLSNKNMANTAGPSKKLL